MNIIKIRQEDRLRKIAQIEASIKKAKKPDYDKLILLCCGEWGISERTAKEYLKQALFNIKSRRKKK